MPPDCPVSTEDAAYNRAAHPDVAAFVDEVRRAFGGAKVIYFGPARPFTRRRSTVLHPSLSHPKLQDRQPMHEQTAAARGHTLPIIAESSEYDFEGWAAPDADFDGLFEMTCSDSGDVFELRGWLFAVTPNPSD